MDARQHMSKDAVILFAHGSRDPEWAVPFEKIKAIVQGQRPHIAVELAFLEIMQPTLLALVDRLHEQGITHVTIAPLFLAPGAHVSRDLPQLVQQARKMYPSMTLRFLPSLGEASEMLEAMGSWVAGRVRSKERA